MASFIYAGFHTTLGAPVLAAGDIIAVAQTGTIIAPTEAIVFATGFSSDKLTLWLAGDALLGSIAITGDARVTIAETGHLQSMSNAAGIAVITSGSAAVVENHGVISSAGVGISMTDGSPFNFFPTGGNIVNTGIISGTNGVDVGSGARLFNTGTITGSTHGIVMSGRGGDATNLGVIEGGDQGVLVLGEVQAEGIDSEHNLINHGTITVRNPVYGVAVNVQMNVDLSIFLLVNSGTIQGGLVAYSSTGIGRDTIQNSGLVQGTIQLAGGADILVNAGGHIQGRLDLGDGADTYDGRGGTVSGPVRGGLGADTYYIDQANITLVETGSDIDTVFSLVSYRLADAFETLTLLGSAALNAAGNSLTNTLTGNAGDNRLTGLAGNDTLNGDLGDDRLLGGGDSDSLDGGDGDDVVLGGAGADTVRGGDGEDVVNGGAGKDFLAGNLGADLFVFQSLGHTGATTATADVISDFVKGDDMIDLRSLDANTSNAASNDNFTFIGTAAFTNVAGQLRYGVAAGYTNVEWDVDGNGIADGMVRLSGTLTLNANDFLL